MERIDDGETRPSHLIDKINEIVDWINDYEAQVPQEVETDEDTSTN
jgi:hypothetical protein